MIVTAHNYGELKLVHTARRLYQRDVATQRKQDLSRRFAVGFSIVCEKYHDLNNDSAKELEHHGNYSRKDMYDSLPDEIQDLVSQLDEYQSQLDDWGLKDYQVNSLGAVDRKEILYTFAHAFVILICAMIPSLILNAPVGVAASLYAKKEAKKDLAASRVKLAARDVLLSKKIVFSILAVPSLLITYGILLRIFTSWETQSIIVLMLCCPLLSYIGVISVQAGMVDLKDLRPGILRLLPGFRSQAARLPEMRGKLQVKVREMVRKYGPQLGPLYYDKDYDIQAVEGLVKKHMIEAHSKDDRNVNSRIQLHQCDEKIVSPLNSPLYKTKMLDESQQIERVQITPQSSGGDYILPLLPSMPEFDDANGNDEIDPKSKKDR